VFIKYGVINKSFQLLLILACSVGGWLLVVIMLNSDVGKLNMVIIVLWAGFFV